MMMVDVLVPRDIITAPVITTFRPEAFEQSFASGHPFDSICAGYGPI